MDKKLINLLKTSKGQIKGIIKMVEDDRYCVDISKQLLAVQALIRKANMQIIDSHIRHCIIDAINHDQDTDKITEIITIIDKYTK